MSRHHIFLTGLLFLFLLSSSHCLESHSRLGLSLTHRFISEFKHRIDKEKWLEEHPEHIETFLEVGFGGASEEEVNAISDASGQLSSRIQALSMGDVIGSVLFGVLNGFTMGMLEGLVSEIRSIGTDAKCQAALGQIKSGFSGTFSSVIRLVTGAVSSKARNGESITPFIKAQILRVIESLKTFVVGLWNLVADCAPVRRLLGMLVLIVVVCLLSTLLLWALPGLGWVMYLVGLVTSLVTGVPFLWNSIKKLYRGIKTVSSGRGDNRQGWIDAITSGAEIVGCITALIIATGAYKLFSKLGRADVVSKLQKENLIKMFKGTFKPNPELVEKVQRFVNALKGSEGGGNTGAAAQEMRSIAKQPMPEEGKPASSGNVQEKPAPATDNRDAKRTQTSAAGTADEAAAAAASTPQQKAALFQEFEHSNPNKVFSEAAPASTKTAVAEFEKGAKLANGNTYGASVKNLDISKVPLENVDDVLKQKGFTKYADVIRDPKTQQPVIVNGREVPMDVYTHPDGGMIRVKPQGQPNSPRSQPHAVKAVRWPPDGDYKSFAQEGFKVDATGRALPKSPAEAFNPYPKDSQAAKNFMDGWAETAHANMHK